MRKLTATFLTALFIITVGALSVYGSQPNEATANDVMLIPEATVFVPGLPEGTSLTLTNVYNYYMELSQDGNPIYWFIVQDGSTLSSNIKLSEVFQMISPNGGSYEPGDPPVEIRPFDPAEVNRINTGHLSLYHKPDNSSYEIRVAIFSVSSKDTGTNSFMQRVEYRGGKIGQGGILPLSNLLTAPQSGISMSSTQYGAANDGVVFPAERAGRIPPEFTSLIYFGAYDHLSGMGQPAENYSVSTYTQADIKREGFISPILWQVDGIDIGNDRIKLSSEYVIDTHVFNESASKGNDYRTSDIREWLNGGFITQAFAGTEANAILPSDVEIRLYDFNSTPLKEIENAESPRIAYGDKLYLPDMPTDGAPVSQKNYATPPPFDPSDPFGINAAFFSRDKDNGDNIGAMTWTRTWTTATQSAEGDHAYSSMPGSNGTAAVSTNRGVAPLTAVKYSSILYISEISTAGEPGKIMADANYYRMPFTEKTVYDGTNMEYFGEEAVDFGITLPAKYYKLTLLNPSIILTSVSHNGISLSNGSVIPITDNGTVLLTANANNHTKIVYKIVRSVSGESEIVGYGEGSALDVNVLAKDMNGDSLITGGDYIVYVWAQKDNAVNSNEGSAPMFFKLDVK